jgi:hypothetical protein
LIDVGDAENVSDTVFDAPKLAVFEGTVAGVQFPAMFQSLVAGFKSQVASWACAAPAPKDVQASSDTARRFGRAGRTGTLRPVDPATLRKNRSVSSIPSAIWALGEIVAGSQRLKDLRSSLFVRPLHLCKRGCRELPAYLRRSTTGFGSPCIYVPAFDPCLTFPSALCFFTCYYLLGIGSRNE